MKLRITVQGVSYDVDVQVLDEGATPAAIPAGSATAAKPAASSGGGEVTSPISGTVFDIRVKPGDVVKVNDTLLVLEAMKMESNVVSTGDGTVTEVCVTVGDSVTHDQVLVKLS